MNKAPMLFTLLLILVCTLDGRAVNLLRHFCTVKKMVKKMGDHRAPPMFPNSNRGGMSFINEAEARAPPMFPNSNRGGMSFINEAEAAGFMRRAPAAAPAVTEPPVRFVAEVEDHRIRVPCACMCDECDGDCTDEEEESTEAEMLAVVRRVQAADVARRSQSDSVYGGPYNVFKIKVQGVPSLVRERDYNHPSKFECPITLQPMVAPVTTACGHSFEMSALEKHRTEGNRTCPICRERLANPHAPCYGLRVNVAMRDGPSS